MNLIRESTWTLRVDASELEFLAGAIELLVAPERYPGPDMGAKRQNFLDNYQGRQGNFLAAMASVLRTEVDREFPPEDFGETNE